MKNPFDKPLSKEDISNLQTIKNLTDKKKELAKIKRELPPDEAKLLAQLNNLYHIQVAFGVQNTAQKTPTDSSIKSTKSRRGD